MWNKLFVQRKFLVSIQIKFPQGQSWVNSGIIANRWLSEYRDMKLICKVRGQAPCLTEPPSQLINAGIALPPVKGMCYCLSLSTKALIHNWLPEPGGLEGSTNYGVDCSKTLPPSKDGESSSNLIPFHSIPGGWGFTYKGVKFLAARLRNSFQWSWK